MKLNVYIDGFNLYYGSLKDTSYKWLDVQAMSHLLFPNSKINKIKYFTARVKSLPRDPGQPQRQDIYFRALKTLHNLDIIEGTYLRRPKMKPLVQNPSKMVQAWHSEEKGSDVNLAVHLLNDAYKKDYDSAVLITNDSDLVEAMRLVQIELGLKVGIANSARNLAYQLRKQASFIKRIRKGTLQRSQFPTQMTDARGTFHKPVAW